MCSSVSRFILYRLSRPHRSSFVVSPELHALYKEYKWALLPEEEIVDQFLSNSKLFGSIKGRKGFPNVVVSDPWCPSTRYLTISQGETFRYTLLPLADLSDMTISRTMGGSTTIHTYPFKTLTLTSHVHPKFALLHLTLLLWRFQYPRPFVGRVLRRNHVVRKVERLYGAWTRAWLPPEAQIDTSFVRRSPRTSH